MKNMRYLLLSAFVAVTLWGIGGCACCSRVPVSLESLNDWFLYHGRACRQYPYSCPRCPYFDCEDDTATDTAAVPSDAETPAQRPAEPSPPPPIKPLPKTY